MADEVDNERDGNTQEPIPLTGEESFSCSRCRRSFSLDDAGQKWGKFGVDVTCPICGKDLGFKFLGYNPFE